MSQNCIDGNQSRLTSHIVRDGAPGYGQLHLNRPSDQLPPRTPCRILSAKLGRHSDLNAATNAAIDKTRLC
jgi:hypothetical protein